jgi:predicted hotdog family 3-hydroxylacyl-ACP dehydratase
MGRAEIAALIPHGGSMMLLDTAERWDAAGILCLSRRHLDPVNPLRRRGVLPAVAGIEFGLQAAALHGALTGGRAQQAGFLALLRDVVLSCQRLDDARLGVLSVDARLDRREAGGLIYSFSISSERGKEVLLGRAVIAL